MEIDALLDGTDFPLAFSKPVQGVEHGLPPQFQRDTLRDAVATAASTSAVSMMSSTFVVLLEVPSRRI